MVLAAAHTFGSWAYFTDHVRMAPCALGHPGAFGAQPDANTARTPTGICQGILNSESSIKGRRRCVGSGSLHSLTFYLSMTLLINAQNGNASASDTGFALHNILASCALVSLPGARGTTMLAVGLPQSSA